MTLLDQLDAEDRATLLRYGFDEERFLANQAAVRSGALSPAGNIVQGAVAPPPLGELRRLPAPDQPGHRAAYDAGMAALRRGEVALAVLNGGMATRFGGVVKGVVDAVDGRSFLEWKLRETAGVAEAAGHAIPVVVMNSFATDEPTRAFLERLAEHMDAPPMPRLFNQFVSMRLRPDGSLFRDAEGRPSLYGPGHGDFHEALRASGTLAWLRGQGVRLMMLSNVDNLGARVDPVALGMHRLAGRAMTVEVAAKAPGDAGGAPAQLDGRTVVIEGFRFPPEFDQERIRVFNTNSFIFDLDALDAEYPLTTFYVEKKVDGRPAVQLERLVGELSSFIPATFLEVPRTGPRGRFFPIKEPDDLPRMLPLLREMLSMSMVTEPSRA